MAIELLTTYFQPLSVYKKWRQKITHLEKIATAPLPTTTTESDDRKQKQSEQSDNRGYIWAPICQSTCVVLKHKKNKKDSQLQFSQSLFPSDYFFLPFSPNTVAPLFVDSSIIMKYKMKLS